MVSAKNKDNIINKELKEEREHPDHIIAEVLKKEEKVTLTSEDFEPKGINAKSSKLFLFVFIFIIALFAFFVGGKFAFEKLSFQPENDLLYYNGFSFSQDPESDIWFTTYKQGTTIYPMQFRYHPTEVKDASILFNVDDLVIGRDAILQALPPINTSLYALAAIEIVTKVSNVFGIASKAGVFSETEDPNDNVSIITCADATKKIAVIIYKKGDTTKAFEMTDNCYIVQGPTYLDVIKMTDKIVYSVLGIL